MNRFILPASLVSRIYLVLLLCALNVFTGNIYGAARPAAPSDGQPPAALAGHYVDPETDPDIVYIDTKELKKVSPAAPAGEHKVPAKTVLIAPVSLDEDKDPAHRAKYGPLYTVVYNYHMGISEQLLTDSQALELFYDACRCNDIPYLSALLQQSAISMEVLDEMSENEHSSIKPNPETRKFIDHVYGFLYSIQAPGNMKQKLVDSPDLLAFITMKLEIAGTLNPPETAIVNTIFEDHYSTITLHKAQYILKEVQSRYKTQYAEAERHAQILKLDKPDHTKDARFLPVIAAFEKFIAPRLQFLYIKLNTNKILTIHEANALFRDICQTATIDNNADEIDEATGKLADLFACTPVEAYLMKLTYNKSNLNDKIKRIVAGAYHFFYKTKTVEDIQRLAALDDSLLQFINARLILATQNFEYAIAAYLLTTYSHVISKKIAYALYRNSIGKVSDDPIDGEITRKVLRDFLAPDLERKLKESYTLLPEETMMLFLAYIQADNIRKLQDVSEVTLLAEQDLRYLIAQVKNYPLYGKKISDFLKRLNTLFYEQLENDAEEFDPKEVDANDILVRRYFPLLIEQAVARGKYAKALRILEYDDVFTERHPELLKRALKTIERRKNEERLYAGNKNLFTVNLIETKLKKAIEEAEKADNNDDDDDDFDAKTELPLPGESASIRRSPEPTESVDPTEENYVDNPDEL